MDGEMAGLPKELAARIFVSHWRHTNEEAADANPATADSRAVESHGTRAAAGNLIRRVGGSKRPITNILQ
jgi:hypothetical protein